MDHFRVAFGLCLKTSLRGKSFTGLHMKMRFAYMFIFLQIKAIFICRKGNSEIAYQLPESPLIISRFC